VSPDQCDVHEKQIPIHYEKMFSIMKLYSQGIAAKLNRKLLGINMATQIAMPS